MGRTSQPLSLNQKSRKITKLSPTEYDQYLMATRKSGRASLDPDDWRTQLHPDSRQRIIDKITNESKRHLPCSSPEEEYQIERTAARFEGEGFAAATSQSDYLQKLARKLLSKIINRPPNSGSTTQRRHGIGGDWQEEVYQKIKALKEMYALELNEMLVKVTAKLLEHDLLRQQPSLERTEKLRIFKTMVERIIAFLHVSKDKISPSFKEKFGSYEKQIINFMNTNRPKKPAASSLHQGQSSLSDRHPMQQKVFCQKNLADAGDWQEDVYQKIKAMKEMYLPELNEMYQKIAAKLNVPELNAVGRKPHSNISLKLELDVLPQQPKSDKLEKVKIFKTMLERVIAFLQVSKSNISPHFKEKLGSYEKQIINFINTNSPRKMVSSQQQEQAPPSHMHPLQQQVFCQTSDSGDWQEEVYQKVEVKIKL